MATWAWQVRACCLSVDFWVCLHLRMVDVLSVRCFLGLSAFAFVCTCLLLVAVCRRGGVLMVARLVGVMRRWRLRGNERSQRTLLFFLSLFFNCLDF